VGDCYQLRIPFKLNFLFFESFESTHQHHQSRCRSSKEVSGKLLLLFPHPIERFRSLHTAGLISRMRFSKQACMLNDTSLSVCSPANSKPQIEIRAQSVGARILTSRSQDPQTMQGSVVRMARSGYPEDRVVKRGR